MYLTDIIRATIERLDHEGDPFASHVGKLSGFRVTFPGGDERSADSEAKAYEMAVIWLANRMSRKDDPTWQPSRDTLHDLGIRITAFLEVTY